MVHGGRGFLDIGVCDRQSKTSDASYEWRLANVITSVASSAFCVKSSPADVAGIGMRHDYPSPDNSLSLTYFRDRRQVLRRRFFSLAGRLTRSARRLTLHLPQGWPWENQFSRALARFRALPLPS